MKDLRVNRADPAQSILAIASSFQLGVDEPLRPGNVLDSSRLITESPLSRRPAVLHPFNRASSLPMKLLTERITW
jgi:hypothetical protein